MTDDDTRRILCELWGAIGYLEARGDCTFAAKLVREAIEICERALSGRIAK